MKKLLLSGVLFLGGFLAARAANTDPADRKKEDVNGTVVHAESKKPLRDVTVTAYLLSRKEESGSTDETGGYAFNALRPGVYKLVFEKAGFRKVTRDKVVVKADETFQLNIEMIENYPNELVPSPFHFY